MIEFIKRQILGIETAFVGAIGRLALSDTEFVLFDESLVPFLVLVGLFWSNHALGTEMTFVLGYLSMTFLAQLSAFAMLSNHGLGRLHSSNISALVFTINVVEFEMRLIRVSAHGAANHTIL
ncbi:MAG: hypothetical protein H0X02_06310 [Nitrosomonas sp.]|nr:hypothetical protein [Nitrosomonas sp.]